MGSPGSGLRFSGFGALFFPADKTGILYHLRDCLMAREVAVLNKSTENMETVASLAATRRAAWEHGKLTLGCAVKLQNQVGRGTIDKEVESALGRFCAIPHRNFDRARRSCVRARLLRGRPGDGPQSAAPSSVPAEPP